VSTSKAAYQAAVLADSPIGYWTLGDASGPAASNSVGGGAAGAYGGTFYLGEPSLYDDATCMYTPSAGGYMVVPSGVWTNPAAFSIELCCKLALGQSGNYMFFIGNGATGNFASVDIDLATSAFTETIWTAPNVSTFVVGSLQWTDGRWHHLVVTRDATQCQIFVDGGLDAVIPGGIAPQALVNSTISIGGWSQRVASTGTRATGFYSDLAVYTHVLSAAAVANHYKTAASNTTMPIGGQGQAQAQLDLLNQIYAAVHALY
jgi:hypothetical protein